jgi:hypothetical protein
LDALPVSYPAGASLGRVEAVTNERLVNETCLAIAKDMLSLVAHLIREEEHRDAFSEFYRIAKQQLLRYEVEQDRLLQRLYGHRRN